MLRYISMAALYDGQNYLVEKYNISLLTPIVKKQKSDKQDNNASIAGFGVTASINGFSPLITVERELDNIVKTGWYDTRGVLNGSLYINESFDKKALQAELARNVKYLHISTHFVLNPASLDRSYMLLGNGDKLLLSEFKNNQYNLSSVEMLTLAACETAVGTVGADGREIESFAVVSLKQGAKSVLATLWPVSDKATSDLMVKVYENIHANPTAKALALATAQRNMIKNNKYKNFQHPHYWAAFVLHEN